jgi:hypothetical protein
MSKRARDDTFDFEEASEEISINPKKSKTEDVEEIKLEIENKTTIVTTPTGNVMFGGYNFNSPIITLILSFIYNDLLYEEGVNRRFFFPKVFFKEIKEIFKSIRMVCKTFRDCASFYWIQMVQYDNLSDYISNIKSGLAIIPQHLYLDVFFDKEQTTFTFDLINDLPLQTLRLYFERFYFEEINEDGVAIYRSNVRIDSKERICIPFLKELTLKHTELECESFPNFNKHLDSLWSTNKADDGTINDLIGKFDPSLKEINLFYDDYIDEIGVIKLPPNLEILNICGNLDIKEKAIDLLPDSLVQINIIFTISCGEFFKYEGVYYGTGHFIQRHETVKYLLENKNWKQCSELKNGCCLIHMPGYGKPETIVYGVPLDQVNSSDVTSYKLTFIKNIN